MSMRLKDFRRILQSKSAKIINEELEPAGCGKRRSYWVTNTLELFRNRISYTSLAVLSNFDSMVVKISKYTDPFSASEWDIDVIDGDGRSLGYFEIIEEIDKALNIKHFKLEERGYTVVDDIDEYDANYNSK